MLLIIPSLCLPHGFSHTSPCTGTSRGADSGCEKMEVLGDLWNNLCGQRNAFINLWKPSTINSLQHKCSLFSVSLLGASYGSDSCLWKHRSAVDYMALARANDSTWKVLWPWWKLQNNILEYLQILLQLKPCDKLTLSLKKNKIRKYWPTPCKDV